MSEVTLVEGKAFKIEPGKKYLITFDSESISTENAEDILKQLHEWGAEGTVVKLYYGNDMKVVEIHE